MPFPRLWPLRPAEPGRSDPSRSDPSRPDLSRADLSRSEPGRAESPRSRSRATARRAAAPAPAPKPANEPAFVDVPHAGAVHRVAIRRSPRARRFTLRVRTAERDVVLTLPPRGSLQAALGFAHAHGGWIAQRLARLPSGVGLEAGAVLPLRGVDHVVIATGSLRGVTRAGIEPGTGRPAILVAGAPEALRRRLLDFLKREARADLEAAVDAYARALGKRPTRVTIKDTKSRWGSCSSRGALSFSWRLVLAPPAVLDYLAAHEVAHLVEMNHSPRFWSTLKRLCPGTDAAEDWLKRNGPRLHAYA